MTLALVSFVLRGLQDIRDRSEIEQLTKHMKTICVGRFLIDLPASASMTRRYESVSGVDIFSTNGETEEEFLQRLAATELEMSREMNRDGQPSLESSKDIALDAARGKVMVYDRRRTKVLEDDEFVFSENVAFLGMVRLADVSITGEVEWLAPRYIESVIGIFERIRPLKEREIPQESGFCLNHAIVQDPYEHDGVESAVLFAGIPGYPDLNIVFSSMAGTNPAPGLLERNARAASREPFFMRLAFSTLHEGQRTINSLPGEELIMRIRELNWTTRYAFQWEMPGRQDDVYAPVLKLELESGTNPVAGGKPVNSSLSRAAMTYLWQKIVSSIRLRPTATSMPKPIARPVSAYTTRREQEKSRNSSLIDMVEAHTATAVRHFPHAPT